MTHPTVVCRVAEVGRDGWLEARTHGLGGSDAAAVCGIDPWSSPFAVYQSKVHPVDDGDNPAMMWGRKLEAVIAEHFAEVHPDLSVMDTGEMYAHPDRPWQLATPDRVLEHPTKGMGILEIKTTNWRQAEHWAGDQVPAAAEMQARHYLEVMGFDWAHVAVLIDGRDYHDTYLEADPSLAEKLTGIESAFWHDRVLGQDPPPVDAHPSTADALAALYDLPTTDEVELPLEAVMALDEIQDVKAQEKALKERRVFLENTVKAALGDAEAGTVDGATAVTWKLIPESEVAATTRKAYRRLNIKKAA